MAIRIQPYKPEPAVGFDHEKSVQVVAYLIRKAGSPVEKMKLIKLVYLADRKSFSERGRPINFDTYASLEHGPIASSALNGMNHALDDRSWDALGLASNKRDVSIIADIADDQLSRSDMTILDAIWEKFGSYTSGQLRKWTHDNCPEYVEVEKGRSLPIDTADILEQLGMENPHEIARDLRLIQRDLGKLARLHAA